MLYLATDHRGFELKEKIKSYLSEKKIVFEDLGAFEYIETDDFPDYAEKLAKKVVEAESRNPEQSRGGIALCGSGAGMSIALNKFDGIRAGLAENPEMAEAMKKDDNINVLVVPADFVGEADAFLMIEKFLFSSFKAEEKYQRRLDKIEKIEESN
ncbi:MAG: hypothetical protein UX16_C0025G0003 [Parcubacteria group bacterium GW2011_GWB1_45_7]|nr:MAG: hypothetical protein UW85_C0025G0002 [Parcubacteria group bacterium GW2011_GWA1_Parcubacteria_45_10]KKU11062.1 MAG: hypothetical protein UX16_C0025G0003 [Parcubacteria group bacterium GW2011_GWB1_45_7]HCI05579.1 ribose-5-phosphate isomerase [Patescibacteria group bacterium]